MGDLQAGLFCNQGQSQLKSKCSFLCLAGFRGTDSSNFGYSLRRQRKGRWPGVKGEESMSGFVSRFRQKAVFGPVSGKHSSHLVSLRQS